MRRELMTIFTISAKDQRKILRVDASSFAAFIDCPFKAYLKAHGGSPGDADAIEHDLSKEYSNTELPPLSNGAPRGTTQAVAQQHAGAAGTGLPFVSRSPIRRPPSLMSQLPCSAQLKRSSIISWVQLFRLRTRWRRILFGLTVPMIKRQSGGRF